MKKPLVIALAVVIAIQLCTPIYRIANKYDILKSGEAFKFKVNPVDPYDAFRGRYVSLYTSQEVQGGGVGVYGMIAVDAEGFAYIASVTDHKPDTGAYVKSNTRYWFSLPIERYYMDEKYAPKAETLAWQRDPDSDCYVDVRVKNGVLVISGLFIDGVAVEDIIRMGLE
jgi:uncharacterized membrane-anchored protein